MKRWVIGIGLGIVLSVGSARAAELQKSLKSRWLGAWVVTRVESYSDCSTAYTNNRVNGVLVKSSGRRPFDAGELAKLERVDLKRSRLDLHLSLSEPVLLARQEGPFTLYREASCRIEVQLELPRSVVKARDLDGIESALAAILERHATESAAVASASYNDRRREDYPDDYEETLRRHASWVASETNAAVQAQLDRAYDATIELANRVSDEAAYAAGLARGVTDARQVDFTSCEWMLAVDLAGFRRRAAKAAEDDPAGAVEARGFEDGRQLVFGLELIRRLPGCFVEVPDAEDDAGD